MSDNDNDITLVTAFIDIGRNNWKNNDYKRTTDFYIDSFLKYLTYPYKMVCYIDEKYVDRVLDIYEKSQYKNKQFISINRNWLDSNIHAWKLIENDRIILNSQEFKNTMAYRLNFMYPDGIPETNVKEHLFPENIYPEYNVTNHSKIDFINHAIKNGYISTYFTGWSDFGYFSSFHSDGCSLPTNIIDTSKLNRNKISICLIRDVVDTDRDMISTLIYAYEVFIGSFYAGPTHIMEEFQSLYHDGVIELYKNQISDDDQHIYIRCHIKKPDIFDLHIFNGNWPRALFYFQKDK